MREDLEALRDQVPALRVHADRGADYRWRAVVTRAEWIAAVAHLAAEVDYDDFKAEVGKQHGTGRARLYERVWATPRSLHRD